MQVKLFVKGFFINPMEDRECVDYVQLARHASGMKAAISI
jgi:hypothetical protein